MKRDESARRARRAHRKTQQAPGDLTHQAAMTPSDYGRPLPRGTWDRQYREGALEFLDSIGELAHYMVIAGYVHYLFKSPTILDVGCGHGRLADLLEAFSFESYVGIDLSPEAIERAELRQKKNTRFHVADFDEWNPTERFVVMVFCESLNYAKHPAYALLRYARALESNGAIIVSLYRHPNHGRIWKNIEKYFRTVDSTTVTNHTGQTWDIKVFRQKPEGALRPGTPVRGGDGPVGRGPGAGGRETGSQPPAAAQRRRGPGPSRRP